MSDPANLRDLNGVLNRLQYSLLQYMREGWPWANATQSDQKRVQTILDLAQKQGLGVERLADFLLEREVIVQNSNYPFDGSALNYTTLDFLKPKLIADQQELVSRLQIVAEQQPDESEEKRLLDQLLADEQQTLEKIKEI